MRKLLLIPLALFIGLVVFLAVGLQRDPHEIPSPLIGKPAPAFDLHTLEEGQRFSPDQFKGKVWLLNVWATWCVSCREEHPALVAFSKAHDVPVVGLGYKEVQSQEEQASWSPDAQLSFARQREQRYLERHGNPYVLSVLDMDGRVGIAYGVYGVPETYLIDKQGVIRFKHVGPLTPELLLQVVLPKVKQWEGA
ncbi:MAG: Thiol:disulfide interchange protein DsbE [Pseudomonadota bacterium]|jgi:cytochrome c biogenesis protein CcmG/thiol:disulfide interchange protein DsbE